MPKPVQLIQEILAAYDEEKQKSTLNEAKFYTRKYNKPNRFCRDCGKETPVVLDSKAGDTVCDKCGLVLNEREIVETPFGRGSGGYSHGSADSDKLDLLTGTKHKEHGRTRRWYKTWLKRKVGEEIDGIIGHTEQVADLAKAMFAKYSDRLEQIRNREQVVEACISAAQLRIQQKERVHESRRLKFKCKRCKVAYSTKQDLRYHSCPVARTKSSQALKSAKATKSTKPVRTTKAVGTTTKATTSASSARPTSTTKVAAMPTAKATPKAIVVTQKAPPPAKMKQS